MVSHVLSTGLKSSVNWLWSVTALTKVRGWVSKILRLTFRPKMNESRRKLGRVQEEDVTSTVSQMEEHGPADDDREERGNIWKTMTWATYDGEVLVMMALRSILGWRSAAWWWNRSAWCMKTDPMNVTRWKHKFGFHNRGVMRDIPMATWAREENDSKQNWVRHPPWKEDVTNKSPEDENRATWYSSPRRPSRRWSWKSEATAKRW